MHQLALDTATLHHFDEVVVDVAGDLCVCRQFDMLVGIDITFNLAIDDDIRDADLARNPTFLTDRHAGLAAVLGQDVPIDGSIDLQLVGEVHIAVDFAIGGNQRDARFRSVLVSKHGYPSPVFH